MLLNCITILNILKEFLSTYYEYLFIIYLIFETIHDKNYCLDIIYISTTFMFMIKNI